MVGRREGEFLAFHDSHPPATVQHLQPPLGGKEEEGGKEGALGGGEEGRKSNIEKRKK